MSIFFIWLFLTFVHLLRFSGATAPPSTLVSMPQATVAAIPSVELNGNLTLPPSPAATTLRNTSNELPPNYLIPDTNPLIILHINPTRRYPIDSYTLTYMIIHGLDSVVQDVIQLRGDRPIPSHGLAFSSNHAAVFVKSHLPGTQSLTYGTTGDLLRGVWEITALFGSCELDMEVYIGRQDAAHYRGHLALYLIGSSGETA